jgi:hypothetical protein
LPGLPADPSSGDGRVRQALDTLKGAVEHPTLTAVAAAGAGLWAAFVSESNLIFWAATVGGIILGVCDTAIGTYAAWRAGPGVWSRRVLFGKFGDKFVGYSTLWLAALVIGGILDAQLDGEKGLLVYILPAAVAGALVAAEGLSVLDHVDALTGGKLKLAWIRGLLERLRATREQEVVTVTGQALHVDTAGGAPEGSG